MEGNDWSPVARRYLPHTNIIETSFETPTGVATVTDLMVLHVTQFAEPEALPPQRLLRVVKCESGTVEGRFVAQVSTHFGREALEFEDAGPHRRTSANSEDHALQIESDREFSVSQLGRTLADFRLQTGERAFFAVSSSVDSAAAPLFDLDDALEALRLTRSFWEEWAARLTYDGPHREMVERSLLALKLLTYSPTGAIIAAPTTSLPEAVPGNRNYDYRFSWIRDASFTISAFCNLGYSDEAEQYLRFLCEVEGDNARELRLLYPIADSPTQERVLEHLPGWNGVGPVRIGNAAADQKQYDIFGEFMVAIHAYLEAVDYQPPEWAGERIPRIVRNLATQALSHLGEPDRGIWELRDSSSVNQHSQAMLWVALDRAVKIAGKLGGFEADEIALWKSGADQQRSVFPEACWNDDLQFYARGVGSDVLDAAVMRTALFGAVDPAGERMRRTLEAIERKLIDPEDEDLVYRYREDDGLEGEEATFLACAFWRVGVLALRGDNFPAEEVFSRLLTKVNDLGLLPEEIEAGSNEFRGNFPQAFSHMCVINHAIRLQEARHAADWPSREPTSTAEQTEKLLP